MASVLNPYAPPYVQGEGDPAPAFLSVVCYGYPYSDALRGQPAATLPPLCSITLPVEPAMQMPTSTLVPLPAPQLPYFCYSTDHCYYNHEIGVKNRWFPSPWSTQTFVGAVAAPAFDPTEVGLPVYLAAFPILLQEDLLQQPSVWHHRPLQPEILPPTPLLKNTTQMPAGGKPPRRTVFLRKKVKVSPRWKYSTMADISATEDVAAVGGSGTVRRRPPQRSGHGVLMKNSLVPRLRRYWRKTAPGEEKFQFKTTGGAVVPEENGTSGNLVGDEGGVPAGAGDARTTVMIKNLPNKLTKEVLLSFLSRHCQEENCKFAAATCGQQQQQQQQQGAANSQFVPSRFDFFYLPMDFGTGSNLGYAFVNFTSAVAAWRLYRAFDKKSWRFLGSKKVCEVTYARIQGLGQLIKHFRNSSFECDRDDLLPVYFLPYCDGTLQGRSHCVGRRVSSSHCWRRMSNKPCSPSECVVKTSLNGARLPNLKPPPSTMHVTPLCLDLCGVELHTISPPLV